MEFEALEDEANAIHGDLWEQLNAGGQVNPTPSQPGQGSGITCLKEPSQFEPTSINKWNKLMF
jgi:hypothetical protein